MQSIALTLSLVLMAAVVLIFGWVVMNASTREAPPAKPFRWRNPVFWILIVAGVIISVATLTPWPIGGHTASAGEPAQVIQAIGHQWRWELSSDTVESGKEVEFQVTSDDVNHGFAIYRNKTELITQTQAMPGFVNKLRVTFEEPGEYEVMCLEYCGLAHHAMSTTIYVR